MLFGKNKNGFNINNILENIKFKLGFCIKKKKQLKNIYLILSNKNQFYNIKLYQNNIIKDFYFKIKFYYYEKTKKEVIISNKIGRSNVYFDIKINKQFIRQYEKKKKYFRDNKVSFYITKFSLYEKVRGFFAKRNGTNGYSLGRIFGEPMVSTGGPSSTNENIYFKNFKAYETGRKPKIFGTYGISKIREVDLLGGGKNKLSKIFGYFHYLSNNNLKHNNINQIYEKKLSDLEYDHEENYSQILKNSEESKTNFIYKLQKFMLSGAEIKIKTKEEQKEKKKTKKKNYKLFDINDYIIKQFLNPNKVEKVKSFKNKYNNNNEKTGFGFDNFDYFLKDYGITEKISHYSKKNEQPIIFLIFDGLIIIKNNIVYDNTIEVFIDVLLKFNENIFEYLLLFAYFLFFIGVIISILKIIYYLLFNFNLFKSKNLFKKKNIFDRNKSYYNFYEYYNRSFSKFYNEKKSMNIDSILFLKDLIKHSIKNKKVIDMNEYLFTKGKKSAVKSNEKNLNKELNSLLNVYSLLSQLTVTKNFRDNIIGLISKQRSKFGRNLRRTLNLKNMEQYYLWDYFNKHIFDEMFFNIVLKDTSFNTILKKNKLKYSKINNFYSNSLFYNKFSNIGISEKNGIFRYDSDFKNIRALKSEIKDMSKISGYSRDGFRSRAEIFDLPTSKLKNKSKLIELQQTSKNDLDGNFGYYIFKNSFKIFIFIFLIHYIIITELGLTLLSLLVVIILYNIMTTNKLKIFFKILIENFIKSLIILLKISFIYIISYILYNIFSYILYNIYAYNISDYLRLINDKNLYTYLMSEYLKYDGLFLGIIKCLYLLETKRNNIQFGGFVHFDVLMKELYLNGFKNGPERSFFDNFFPFFRRWFYKLKIKRNESEEKENYELKKQKAVERAKKMLSEINDTASFKRYFDFSFSTLIEEQFYKYLRNPYYAINLVQVHLILGFIEAYNEGLAKISKIRNVYENYFYLYLQKTNFILKVYLISKPKYYIYIQKIQGFFYFNRKIIGSVKYILLGMFVCILIIYLYLYFILKTYFNLISKNEIITRDFHFIGLNRYYKKILFSDNLIIKTINDSRFISRFRFLMLKQQFKILAESANIKIMIK